MSDLASLVEVNIKHASQKHRQTIVTVEKSLGTSKRTLELNPEEEWKKWHKYVPLATFVYNSSHHSAINCCPSTFFQWR